MLTASENSNLLQIYNFRAVVGAHYTKLNVHSFFYYSCICLEYLSYTVFIHLRCFYIFFQLGFFAF